MSLVGKVGLGVVGLLGLGAFNAALLTHGAPAAAPALAPAPAAVAPDLRRDILITVAGCQLRRQALIDAFPKGPAVESDMAADDEAACLDGAKHLHDLGLAQPVLMQAALARCSDELTTRGLAFVDISMATQDGRVDWDRINVAGGKFRVADQQDRDCTDALKEAFDG
jgi:hypothetical protein